MRGVHFAAVLGTIWVLQFGVGQRQHVSIRQGLTRGITLHISLLSFPGQVQVPAQAMVHTPRRCVWHCLDSAVHPDGSGCLQGV
jgi:hypothetical protein